MYVLCFCLGGMLDLVDRLGFSRFGGIEGSLLLLLVLKMMMQLKIGFLLLKFSQIFRVGLLQSQGFY